MTDHDVDGVEYVPVCDQCWKAVQLTEADDGTFEHIPRIERPVPTSVRQLMGLAEATYRGRWAKYWGTEEFAATWDPEKGLMAFQEEFYGTGEHQPDPLPKLERHDDELWITDYDGVWSVLLPGETFRYGLRDG